MGFHEWMTLIFYLSVAIPISASAVLGMMLVRTPTPPPRHHIFPLPPSQGTISGGTYTIASAALQRKGGGSP